MEKNNTAEILCHRCKFGNAPGHMEQCSCPDLGEACNYIAVDHNQATAMSAAKSFAERTGLGEYDPISFVAPVMATIKHKCKHYCPL